MSYRGSFVTEYIYCEECAGEIRRAVRGYDWVDPDGSGAIIAGYFSDISSTEAVSILKRHLERAKLCKGHSVTVAVIPEDERRRFWTFKGA
jgi:hypothetical protein